MVSEWSLVLSLCVMVMDWNGLITWRQMRRRLKSCQLEDAVSWSVPHESSVVLLWAYIYIWSIEDLSAIHATSVFFDKSGDLFGDLESVAAKGSSATWKSSWMTWTFPQGLATASDSPTDTPQGEGWISIIAWWKTWLQVQLICSSDPTQPQVRFITASMCLDYFLLVT